MTVNGIVQAAGRNIVHSQYRDTVHIQSRASASRNIANSAKILVLVVSRNMVQVAGQERMGTGVEASPTQISLKPPGNQTLIWE